MSLELLGQIAHVSLQEAPKLCRRKFGVPPGGPYDVEAWTLANILAGNREPQAALEIAFGELRAKVLEACRITVLGAKCGLDGVPSLTATFHASKGQLLSIEPPFRARTYLAVAGGWINSDERTFEPGLAESQEPLLRTIGVPAKPGEISVIPFRSAAPLDGQTFAVTTKLDRKGIRLEGASRSRGANGVSEPTVFGAIQATHDGQLIILGPDGPTVGGYPTQAVVARCDLDALGRLRPGDTVTFRSVTTDQAHELWLFRKSEFESRASKLRAQFKDLRS